jgi:hypothetical protein
MKKESHDKLIKIEVGMAIVLFLVGALAFFSGPSITGHVASDLNTQPVDMLIDESQLFELTTASPESFHITSFRLSGKIIGNGIAEAYLDNGRGQQLMILNNIKEKEQGMGGLTGITAQVVGETSNEEIELIEVPAKKTLVIKPAEVISQNPVSRPNEEQTLFKGEFDSRCIDTCFIEMEMGEDIGYNLIFRLEPGTQIHLTKIQYTIKEDE